MVKFLFDLSTFWPRLLTVKIQSEVALSLPLSCLPPPFLSDMCTGPHVASEVANRSAGVFLVTDGYARNYASLFLHQETKETVGSVRKEVLTVSFF